MVGSIVVVSVLTCYTLIYTVYDLKSAQMNVQHSGTYALRVPIGPKCHGRFDVRKVKAQLIEEVEEISLSLQEPRRSVNVRPKIEDSEVVVKAKKR